MEIEIIAFGKIAEFIRGQRISLTAVSDTEQLRKYLEDSYPLLSGTKYKLAINKRIIQQKTAIQNNDSVAIMPPFSGG